jgi:hypothetical protein
LQETAVLCDFLNIPPADWLPIGAVFLKLHLVIKFNCTNFDFYKANYNAKDRNVPKMLVGFGLFLAFSLMNHSCDANSFHVFYGTSIVIRARRPIKKGEEITFCYGKPATHYSYEERQRGLLKSFKFNCR